MRDEIVKYLGTAAHASAKSISERLGLHRLEVAKELNHMHGDALVEREKRGGGGNEYVYWLALKDSAPVAKGALQEPPKSLVEAVVTAAIAASPKVEKPEEPKPSAAEKDRARLEAELFDLRASNTNQREKIRELTGKISALEKSIKESDPGLPERYSKLVDNHDALGVQYRASQAAIVKLSEEVETLREQIAARHQPIGASVAEALKPFLLPGQKIIWREPFRWHDADGVMPNHFEGLSVEDLADNFGYQIVVNCELAAIIQPREDRKNDASDAVRSAEAAGVR